MKSGLRFDYAAVGHVTVDVLADGTRRAGGTALYSALQASRLGLRTVIVTQGVAGEIEETGSHGSGAPCVRLALYPETRVTETVMRLA